jgi:transcriptional regulator with PAS, ATPase and Fis domain
MDLETTMLLNIEDINPTETMKRKKSCKIKPYYHLWDPINDQFWAIPKGEFLFGKSTQCGIKIPHGTISRIHAKAILKKGILYITDMQSRNGVFNGGHKVKECIIPSCSPFYLGDILLFMITGKESIQKFGKIISRNSKLIKLLKDIKKTAPNNISIMINGETGTGKELASQFIHNHSVHFDGPFLAINCGAIPHQLMESELFGHVKGAFSGAHFHREGVIAKANGGTLFLDEIGELKHDHQSSLLRFIETGLFRPVGSDKERLSHVRIIAATHKNLRKESENGNFRLDLWFRLSEISFSLPNLQSRIEDIPLLIEQFGAPKPSNEIIEKLLTRNWDGNIRELRNISNVAKIFGWKKAMELLESSKNPPTIETTVLPETLYYSIQEKALRKALFDAAGNVSAASRLLGIPRTTLINKMKRVGLN